MNINSLPDVALRHIFSNLPLTEQIQLHQVCPHWASIQSSVTCTQKSLTLLIGESYPDPRQLISTSGLNIPHLDRIDASTTTSTTPTSSSDKGVLRFTTLNQDLTSHLGNLFPNLHSLRLLIHRTDPSIMIWINQLLGSWGQELKTLEFYCLFDHVMVLNENTRERFVQLLIPMFEFVRTINEDCLKLQFLTFDFRGELYPMSRVLEDDEELKLDLICLERLKEFRFFSGDSIEILFDSLKNYAAGNEKLERIFIGNAFYSDNFARHFNNLPALTRKFIGLPNVMQQETSVSELRIYLSRFTFLTTLWMDFYELNLVQFTSYLAPLHSLVHLSLSIYDDKLAQYDEVPSYDLHQLEAVKILAIELHSESHTELQSRHWGWIFPCVQFVELVKVGVFEVGTVDQRVKHMRKLLEPLKRCLQLKRILTIDYHSGNVDGEKREWCIDEL